MGQGEILVESLVIINYNYTVRMLKATVGKISQDLRCHSP